jgi:imidazolonepropionase-like amidohydrolase
MSFGKIESLYERILRAIERCSRAGVKIGLGADLLGARFHHLQGMEFKLRGEVQAPIEVLRSATSINAELLQLPDKIGCVKAGAFADLIILNFDPMKNLSPFSQPEQNIQLVMKNGDIVRTELS